MRLIRGGILGLLFLVGNGGINGGGHGNKKGACVKGTLGLLLGFCGGYIKTKEPWQKGPCFDGFVHGVTPF